MNLYSWPPANLKKGASRIGGCAVPGCSSPGAEVAALWGPVKSCVRRLDRAPPARSARVQGPRPGRANASRREMAWHGMEKASLPTEVRFCPTVSVEPISARSSRVVSLQRQRLNAWWSGA